MAGDVGAESMGMLNTCGFFGTVSSSKPCLSVAVSWSGIASDGSMMECVCSLDSLHFCLPWQLEFESPLSKHATNSNKGNRQQPNGAKKGSANSTKGKRNGKKSQVSGWPNSKATVARAVALPTGTNSRSAMKARHIQNSENAEAQHELALLWDEGAFLDSIVTVANLPWTLSFTCSFGTPHSSTWNLYWSPAATVVPGIA